MSTNTTTTGKNGTIVVAALRARANFGKLLNRVEDERRSLIIEKRGTPRAVLMSIRDYVKLAAPEPERGYSWMRLRPILVIGRVREMLRQKSGGGAREAMEKRTLQPTANR